MNSTTLEAYLRFSLYYSLTIWAVYLTFFVVSVVTKKWHLLSFKIALVCFVLLSEEIVRVYCMLSGLLSESLKPIWLTVLMNIPFGGLIYEIFVRKLVVDLFDKWRGRDVGDHGLRPRSNSGRVHSAVTSLSRPEASQ